jgi:predicted CopG family antitoxin
VPNVLRISTGVGVGYWLPFTDVKGSQYAQPPLDDFMNYYYYFMNSAMYFRINLDLANLQIKGFDDALYTQIKKLAASENRSISQQILFLIERYIANKKQFEKTKTPAQVLMELSGSWEDSRDADEIISDIKKARKNSPRFTEGSDVFT